MLNNENNQIITIRLRQNESCPFDIIHIFLIILYYNFKLSKQTKILALYFSLSPIPSFLNLIGFFNYKYK